MYGVTINGTDFTIANEAAYGKTIKFTVKYADATVLKKEKIKTTTLTVKVQKAAITSEVTLKATHELSIESGKKWAFLPLADLAASITEPEAKYIWNNGKVTGYATIESNSASPADKVELISSKKYGNPADYLAIANGYSDNPGNNVLNNWTQVKSTKVGADNKVEKVDELKDAAYLAFEVTANNKFVTADTYSGLIQFTITGTDASGKSKSIDVKATVELTLTNPASAVSRIPMYFDGDKLAAYGDEIEENLLSYDVKTAYNNANKAVDFTVTAKADKDKWNVVDGSTVKIPLNKLYTETQKFEVSYKHFENAIYNAATETIYITGQSPIKDGTITVSKTTLDLATGSDSFLSADVAGKDAFNKAYKLLNSFTAETNDTPAAQKDVMDARIADIELVATGENAGAFDVTPVYKKLEGDNLVDGTETDGELVGWTIALKPNTAIQNGATITFDLNITDKWGVELPAQKVSLTVKK